MSREIRCKLSEEKTAELEERLRECDRRDSGSLGKDALRDIKLFCMEPSADQGKLFPSYQTDASVISLLLSQIESDTDRDILRAAVEQIREDRFVWCSYRDCSEDTESIKKSTAETLMVLKRIVQTPDFFEERDKFWEKYERISEEVDDFAWICCDASWAKLLRELEEFRVDDDDDDCSEDFATI